jgi:hypothetical protein
VSTSDPHPEISPAPEIPCFGEPCASKTRRTGIFHHPCTGALIEAPNAGCARFWIALEFGRWIFPNIEGSLNVLTLPSFVVPKNVSISSSFRDVISGDRPPTYRRLREVKWSNQGSRRFRCRPADSAPELVRPTAAPIAIERGDLVPGGFISAVDQRFSRRTVNACLSQSNFLVSQGRSRFPVASRKDRQPSPCEGWQESLP